MDAYFFCQRLQPIDFGFILSNGGPQSLTNNYKLQKKKKTENWKFVMTYLAAKLDVMWREAMHSLYPLFINFTAEICFGSSGIKYAYYLSKIPKTLDFQTYLVQWVLHKELWTSASNL